MADGFEEMFDEDEQDRPVAFEQDADDDEAGNGYFIYPDGSRKYGSDYDEAMRLNREGKAKGIDVTSQSAPEPEPVTPIGLEPPEEEPEEKALGASQPAREAPPTLMQQAPPAKPLPLASQSRQVQMQDQQSMTQTGGSSSSVQRTGSAVPREEFERGRTNIREAYANQIQDQQVRDMDTQDFYAKRREQLMRDAADAEAKVAAAQAQNQQRQQIAQQKYQEIAARKEDPFEGDGGIIGTIMAGIAVYLGGISSGMLGGPNQAMEAVQENRRAAVEAQRDQKNSMLRQLEKELGSLEAAVPALEAKMNRAAAVRTEAFLADEKSLEMRQKGQQFIGALRTEAAMKDQEALKNFYGNMAQSQAQQSGTTSTVGTSTATSEGENRTIGAGAKGGGMDLKKIMELKKALEEAGYTREEQAAYLEKMGVAAPSGESEAEFARKMKGKDSAADKYSEAEGKAQSAQDSLENFGKKAGLVRNPTTGEWEPSKEGIVPPGFVESINPFDDNSISAAGEAAIESYGRFQSGGVIGDEERKAFREQLGLNTGNRQQLAAKLNAAEKTIKSRRPKTEREKKPGAPEQWR